jgi:hypothetical protein
LVRREFCVCDGCQAHPARRRSQCGRQLVAALTGGQYAAGAGRPLELEEASSVAQMTIIVLHSAKPLK